MEDIRDPISPSQASAGDHHTPVKPQGALTEFRPTEAARLGRSRVLP